MNLISILSILVCAISLLAVLVACLATFFYCRVQILEKWSSDEEEIMDLLTKAKWAIDGLLRKNCDCDMNKMPKQEIDYFEDLIKKIEEHL